ncbi:unnamed protein product [Peniophora sp. CBMAI 1063]|nr:unnamed protein product [Peniophora sp. CBMAI 1063]
MTEFVSALFKFVPENEDELPLEIGERVEVLEKDQFHNDGWWTGRNASGRVGIFPANYAESVATPPSPDELTSPDSATLQRQFDTLYDSIEMHFTQRQSLARKPTYASYVSSDTEDEDEEQRASKGLRLKIALDARKARAEARRHQKEFGINSSLPPIDDDDSETETDKLESAQRHRLFDSDDEGDADPFERILFRKPTRGRSLRRAATRRRPSLPETEPVPALPTIPSQVALVSFADGTRTFSPEPIKPTQTHTSGPTPTASSDGVTPSSRATLLGRPSETPAPANDCAAPVASSAARPVPSKTESIAISEYSILRAPSSKSRPARPNGEPQSWSVSDVVIFLKSRGFSDDVCSCFQEQDIAGDVLAELSVDNLDTEIGISALGTRKRIVAAIGDLGLPRRQPTPEPAVMKDELKPSTTIDSIPFGLPSPVTSSESEPLDLKAPPVRPLSPYDATGSLPTPEPSPRKGSIPLVNTVDSTSPLSQRGPSTPSSPPPAIAVSSLPMPPETYPDPPVMITAPRSPELLPASLSVRHKSSAGALLTGPRPRPVSASSALSAMPMSSSHATPNGRPSVSPPPTSSKHSPPPPSSGTAFLPPGAARPRIPGAPLPYEGLPQSLVPGGAHGRAAASAQHARHASNVGPSTTALPAPVFHQPTSTAVVGASAKPRIAQAHHQSASVSHITAAMISGPFEVARATASAASGNKHLPDLLVPGRTRVAAPRGPRGWRIRS